MCTNTFAIHATPVGGVSFIGLYDLLCTSEYKNSWKIYRNLEIENFTKEDFLSAHKKINEASMYFFYKNTIMPSIFQNRGTSPKEHEKVFVRN